MNDQFLQGGFKKADLFFFPFPFCRFLSSLKTWIPPRVLCRSHEQKYAQLHFQKCVYKPFYKKKKRKT